MTRAFRTFAVATILAAGSLAVAQGDQQGTAPQGNERPRRMGPGQGGRFNGIAGNIVKIAGETIEVKQMDGEMATVKVNDKTEIRKGRETKMELKDLRIGDRIAVQATKEGEVWNATGIFLIPADAENRARQQMQGEMGKTMVIGKVKAIDPPKVTVERMDGVVQTIEADENTSIHKQRDAITMGDIQVGDAIMARGEVKNGVFVPTSIMLPSPQMVQMYQRFQEGQAGSEKKPAKPAQKSGSTSEQPK